MIRTCVLSAILLITVLFSGCSKDDDNSKTITNLSGETWYKTNILLHDTSDGESQAYEEVGTIDDGQSITINSDKPYFHVFAKDSKGMGIISIVMPFNNDKATVTAKDLKQHG